MRLEARSERRWDRVVRSSEGEIEVARSSGEIKRRGAAIDNRHGAIVGLELGLWSPARSLLPLSLRSGLSLSLSLSLSLCVSCSLFWFVEAFGSLALSLFCAWKETV